MALYQIHVKKAGKDAFVEVDTSNAAMPEAVETPIEPAALASAEALTEGVADPALREALRRAVAKSLSRPKSL